MSKAEKALCYIISVLFPPVGFVLFLVWMGNQNAEKRTLGIRAALVSLAVVLLFVVVGIASYYAVDTTVEVITK
ncbi:hypothetical protein [Ectobacillus ponti]|uniref:Uncharacterized protein n=1 Tax=Ectobacillus ponti TaxID=2961894 RepID=A0AA41X482_9BACI|nr:hypothetical protein [Ectobacillus ponti]MCP8968437.1 hypothetical protein [Ectobacillus ponti]